MIKTQQLRTRLIAAILIAAQLLLLVGCGAEVVKNPNKEEDLALIEIDRPKAMPYLLSYMSKKYGLSEADYSVVSLKPIRGSGYGVQLLISGDKGPYNYEGIWQASILVAGKDACVRLSISEPYPRFDPEGHNGKYSNLSPDELAEFNAWCSFDGYDTLQADEYFVDFNNWFYRETGLSEDCEVSVTVDESSTGLVTPLRGTLDAWFVALTGTKQFYRTLEGYYDGVNIFSPINKSLSVTIRYPEDMSASEYLSAEDVARMFPESVTGDISVHVWHKLKSLDLINLYSRSSSKSPYRDK